MEANVLVLTCFAPPPLPTFSVALARLPILPHPSLFKPRHSHFSEEEELRKIEEYREICTRLKGYPEEDVRKAWRLVSSLIRAAEEVEEEIEKAAEKGELNELVLMVIWNRLDLARRDEEKDAIRSLDLLYRRDETEILKREATPAMRLLNDLLNMHDGFDDEGWMKGCKKRMVDTFPREDPFSILVPAGFDIDKAYTNLTNEDTLNDNLGDETFVAGVIVSRDAECLGLLLCLRECGKRMMLNLRRVEGNNTSSRKESTSSP
ncbi:hypothetical protein SO802_008454 [Lithocarpus litseifolius]|uniref:Uncharacterized protein n=1 Tax=Lithocarpus litseifolius TaxID=425828 RepID=A0AAW2D8M7_9ROSI